MPLKDGSKNVDNSIVSPETVNAAREYLRERDRLEAAHATLRERLRAESKQKRQRRIAQDLDLFPQHLNQILSGTRNITERVAQRIAGPHVEACTS